MRRFLITNSEKFTGQAELVYNEKETLCIIDCSNTNMDQTTMLYFKNAAPITIATMGKAFSKDTTVVESDFEVTFDKFYKDYPLKRNRFKGEAAFNKLSKTDQVKAFFSLHAYKKYLTRNTWLSPMISDRYLKDHEFETDWNKIK